MTDAGEPAWLTAKVDQRLALMADKMGDINLDYSVVMTPVSEPREGATREEMVRWERSCDNCGLFCPGAFYTGTTTRKGFDTQVIFTFGACPKCAGKEGK